MNNATYTNLCEDLNTMTNDKDERFSLRSLDIEKQPISACDGICAEYQIVGGWWQRQNHLGWGAPKLEDAKFGHLIAAEFICNDDSSVHIKRVKDIVTAYRLTTITPTDDAEVYLAVLKQHLIRGTRLNPRYLTYEVYFKQDADRSCMVPQAARLVAIESIDDQRVNHA